MSDHNMIIHLIAGGLAGTTGAIVTSPLEVVKIRFQADQRSYKKVTSSTCNVNKSVCQSSSSSSASSSSSSSLVDKHSSSSSSSSSNRVHSSGSGQFGNKNTLKSYSNILLRNNHGGANGLIANSLNLELSHHRHHPNSNFDYSIKNYYSNNNCKIGTNIFLQFKNIIENEGFKALFKGLGPNIIGVAPYRAIYFFSYASSKSFLVRHFGEERPVIHVASAFAAGFTAVSITNPIWFIKTRLQLDETRRGSSTLEVVNKILKEKGPLGFYKGISASYFGVAESALYFVIYEKLKSMSKSAVVGSPDENKSLSLFTYLSSAGFSKTLASCLCYPHEVARTRLRLEGDKYTGFFQTLSLIVREEGARGLYKGMATHLIRQIPNTAIVMTTYELIINYWSATNKSNMLPSDEE